MSRALYFAYGSNLDADQMRGRCASAQPLGRARLPDHRLDFTHLSRRWGGGAADILPCRGASVWGVVYEMAAHDLGKLDRFEGGYDRVLLDVEREPERVLRVTSYTARQKGRFLPTRVYVEQMLRWGARFGLPDAYLAWLRSHPTREDRAAAISPADPTGEGARRSTRPSRPPR